MHRARRPPPGLCPGGYDARTMASDTRWKPSVTVAAVIEQEGRFLLVEEHTADGLRLNNPAGHLDPGESLLQAVVREVLEETACAFTPTHLIGTYLARLQRDRTGEDITYLRFAFIARALHEEAGRPLDHGCRRALWLTPTEIRAERPRHRSPQVERCLDDYLAGTRYSLDLLKEYAPAAAR